MCLPWLRAVTGIHLTDTIDMTCSKYGYTDTLLCHDDELEGRRIAFVYYLVSGWTHEDGGKMVCVCVCVCVCVHEIKTML